MSNPGHTELDPDQLLIAGAHDLGIRFSSEQIAAFRLYRQEILRWSERINLTALTTPADIVLEGFLDSLACLALMPNGPCNALDIGSGAGFPAIPLALVRDEIKFTLIEASRKKTTFLRHIVRSLNLRNVQILCGRVEVSGDASFGGEEFDLAFARAVAPLADQAVLVSPHLRSGGFFLAQVGATGITKDTLNRVRGMGYECAGAFQVPTWKKGSDRRIIAFQLRG